MPDETELNIELSVEQLKVESALNRLSLPDGRLDQHTLMYRAGWSAAMDEVSVKARSSAGQASNVRSRAWPVMTLAFAATTAACLAIILVPQGDEQAPSSHGVAIVNSDQPEDVVPKADEVKITDRSWPVEAGRRLPANLFGISWSQFALKRNEDVQRHLAEAASPNHIRNPQPFADWEIEAATPLTPASVKSFF